MVLGKGGGTVIDAGSGTDIFIAGEEYDEEDEEAIL